MKSRLEEIDTELEISAADDGVGIDCLAGQKRVPQSQYRDVGQTPRLIPVKELSQRYGISQSAIYEFIKTDSTFPYRNVGVKKKFVVNPEEFEVWLERRTNMEKKTNFDVPSTDDLLGLFKRGAG